MNQSDIADHLLARPGAPGQYEQGSTRRDLQQ